MQGAGGFSGGGFTMDDIFSQFGDLFESWGMGGHMGGSFYRTEDHIRHRRYGRHNKTRTTKQRGKSMKNIITNIKIYSLLGLGYVLTIAAAFFALGVFIIEHLFLIVLRPRKTARLFKYYSMAQEIVLWNKVKEDPIEITVRKKLAEKRKTKGRAK